MKVYLIICLVLGVELFHTADAYSKCNPKIIKKIKKYWNGKPPQNLRKQAEANGKELVIATTAGYYQECTKCVYSVFNDHEFTMTTVPDSGIPETKRFTIEEDNGKTITRTGGKVIVRYHVYQQKGVTAIYTCNEEGEDSKSTPDGFIKIKDGSADKSALHQAHKVLYSIGIELKDTYCNKSLGLLVVGKPKEDKSGSSSSESSESKSSKSSSSSED